MRTVPSILESIYATQSNAAATLGVGRSAVSNWKALGYFPTRLLARIVADAAAANVDLPITEIPTMENSRAQAERAA